MPPRRLVSDPRVTANVGRVALARGPLVYCVESHDRPGLEQDAFALPDDAAVTAGSADERLPGMTLLDTTAVPLPGTPERGALYQSVSGDSQCERRAQGSGAHPRHSLLRLGQSGAKHHGCMAAAAGGWFQLGIARRTRWLQRDAGPVRCQGL